MPDLDVWLAFFTATLVFASMPGPALLYTAAQTAAHGRRAGFMAALGIHLGCYAHVLAAALGLSAIFQHVPEAYVVVKVAGAGYLVWLGISMIRQKTEAADLAPVKVRSATRALGESMLVEILNPKVAIFFIAFLPQFVDPTATFPVPVQFLVFGAIVNLAFSSADIVAVLLASKLIGGIQRHRLGERAARIGGGSVLVALGVRLALSRQP